MNKNILVPVTSLSDWVLIDEGHFGSVYKAKHEIYKIHVAVKKHKRNVQNDLKALISEAEKMASASNNPFVIRLYGFLNENTQGPPGIVMEYMKNGSLCALMERVSPIPWALKYRIIHQVTLGMNWLHNLPSPLLHLDLKTRNVLLDEELHIKITDFGLSKYRSYSAVCASEDGEGVGGTLEYMPPEAFQEGYQPSTATDVYSFAILCAVVLRGQNPYPVDKSVLIRELVPRGQRPSLEELENEMSVKYLNEAIEFTKRCWDTDKHKRPPFSECCNEWEFFSAAYKCNIKQAVSQVQDMMDSSVSSRKTTDKSNTENTASLNTKDMSEMVHRFKTMNVSESPSALLESVPEMRYPNMHSQPKVEHPKPVPHGYPQGAVGSHSRSKFMYYPVSGSAMSSPNMQSQPTRVFPQMLPQASMGYSTRFQPTYSQGVPQFGYQPFTGHVPQPYNHFPPSSQPKTTSINIQGCTNIQIGDHSIMTVTDKAPRSPYPNVNYRAPAHTVRSPHPIPMSPQPKQTTQGTSNMPARQVSSDRPCKQGIAVKSDQQSHIHPVQNTPGRHSVNASNTQQVTQDDLPIRETKHPGQ